MSEEPSPAPALDPPDPATPDGEPLPPVVLVHGLLNPSLVMWPMCWRLRRLGRDASRFGYRSRWRDIPDNARELAAHLRRMGHDTVDIVTFSMGGVVLRWAAANFEMPRLRRVVMIAPPNRGAAIADVLHRRLGPFFPLIYGQGAMQVRTGAGGITGRLGPLDAEVGVIAGGTGTAKGINPLVPGDNDFTVAVQETILPGMKDFVLVKSQHTMLLFRGEVTRLAAHFLEHGRFRQAVTREHGE